LNNTKEKQIDQNCPNCGAPTKATVKGKCQCCNTIINQEYSGWHIASHKLVAEQVVENI
jgi:predicted amidophosphoribosyltransferase